MLYYYFIFFPLALSLSLGLMLIEDPLDSLRIHLGQPGSSRPGDTYIIGVILANNIYFYLPIDMYGIQPLARCF